MRARNGILVWGFDGWFKGCAVPARDDCFHKSFISLGAGDLESEIGETSMPPASPKWAFTTARGSVILQTFSHTIWYFYTCNLE